MNEEDFKIDEETLKKYKQLKEGFTPEFLKWLREQANESRKKGADEYFKYLRDSLPPNLALKYSNSQIFLSARWALYANNIDVEQAGAFVVDFLVDMDISEKIEDAQERNSIFHNI